MAAANGCSVCFLNGGTPLPIVGRNFQRGECLARFEARPGFYVGVPRPRGLDHRVSKFRFALDMFVDGWVRKHRYPQERDASGENTRRTSTARGTYQREQNVQ